MNTASRAASAPLEPALIGRDRERRIVGDALATALGGQGKFVLIGGEAGIGKSTLAEATCRAASGAIVLVGHCYELSETPPYGPWVEIFSRYRPEDGQPALPEEFARPGAIGAVESQATLFQEVRAFYTALASPDSGDAKPVVILLEDLHWSDPASIELLRYLARELVDVPALLLATYRSDEITSKHPLAQLLPALIRESRGIHLELQRLEKGDIQTLLAHRYALRDRDRDRLLDYLYERAEGNPFFTIEVIHTLEEGRILHPTVHGWQVEDLSRVPVPAVVRQVIESRLARLDLERRQQLAIAAVIGQEIWLPLWAAVAESDMETLSATIERAVASHLVEESPDGYGLRFAHALIRETLYQATPLPLRQAWHRNVGEALIAGPNPDPDSVANHFQRAGDDRAVEWLIQAGHRAQRAFAWATATARYQTALDLLEQASADTEQRVWLLCLLGQLQRYSDPQRGIDYIVQASRLAAITNDPLLMAVMRYYEGHLRTFAGDGARGLELQRAGLAALDALDVAVRQRFKTILDEGRLPHEYSPWASCSVGLVLFGHYRESERLVARLIQEEASQADHLRNAAAYRALVEIHGAWGRPDAARQAAALARAGFEARGHQAMVGNTAMIELHSVLIPYQTDRPIELQAVATIVEQAWTRAGGSVTHPDFSPRSGCLPLLVLTGDWDEASETGAVILRLDWFTDAMSGAIARLERWRGNPELAREIIASRLTAGPHSPPGQLHYRTGLELQCVAAALALDDSDLELARRWLEAHDGWLDWSGTMLGRAESYLAWARWHRAAGNLEQSATYVKRALADTREPRQPLALIGAHRLLGELEADLGRYDVSEKHLKESLSLAEACAAPYEQARTYHALAMLAHARGETDAAMQRAEEAREICTRLGAQLLLARIDELQAVLNSDSAVALPAGITQREVEVLRLAAQGFDNAAIAEQLFISAHTVHRHMANILTKLDLPTRTAAVAWALRHDLL